ncbi:MAG: hypothetical protein KC609_12680, partial [Myxococcales bacterium]|nr:hypothetical protein [Myxococcales bacterium]
MKPTVTNYKKLLKDDPANREAIDFLEENFVTKHKWPALIELYSDVVSHLESEGRSEELWTRIARVLQHVARSDSDPTIRAHALVKLGEVLEGRFDRRDAAAECYVQGFKLAPNVAAIERLLSIYRGIGEWSFVATLLFEKLAVCEDDAQRAVSLVELGRVRGTRLDDVEGAEEAFQQALEMLPGFEAALDELAALAEDREELSPVVQQYIAEAEAAPNIDQAANLFRKVATLIYQERPNSRRVADYLWRSFERNPFNVETRVFIESYFGERGDWESLRHYYVQRVQKAQSDADLAESYVSLSFCLENLGRPEEEIIPVYEAAFERLPSEQSLLQKLVEYYSQRENWAALVRTYKTAMRAHIDEDEQLKL